ncbi:MAG: hypothetical protein NXI24_13125 [bacterium]|nr:hypothetical protein [bacterium]
MKSITKSDRTASGSDSIVVPLNRAERRAPASASRSPLSRLWRGAAYLALFGMLHTTLPPLHELVAQPFRSFDDQSEEDMDRFVDRASRLNDVDAWSNYVETGIAQERVQWEEEAYAALRDRLLLVEEETDDPVEREARTATLEAEFEVARVAWETDAIDYFLDERGTYRGERAAIDVEFAAEEEYEALVAEVEAQTAADLELDLTGWDARMSAAGATIVDDFEVQLTADLDAARAAFAGDPAERAAFEAQLDQRAAELRQEFEIRDHFYTLRAKNDYVARIREDDVSARLIADASSADAYADGVMARTSAELEANTSNMLSSAQDQIKNLSEQEMPDANTISSLSGDWEKQVENVIASGLRRWDVAEEQLYSERLRWQAESERSRAEGEAIWSANHDKLVEAREEWLSEIRAQIAEGRALWEAKFTEFADSRAAAEASLNDFVAEELARRTASMDRLGDMVRGGGSALLQAKEAYAYYDGLLAEMGTQNCANPGSSREAVMYCFYEEQRDQTQAAIGRFQAILGESEIVLGDLMNSDATDSGFLNDRRSYAGDLVQDIVDLGVGDFEDDLIDEMSFRGEDFLLYQRDISGIIESNGLFTDRTAEIESNGVLDFEPIGDAADLRDLVNGLDLKYDDHRRELLAILDVDRSGLADDAARLEAIKTEFRTWFADSQDRNGRLRTTVLEYFQGGSGGGGAGYYLSANENDPYFMTAAELEWEQLRRERNYLAKRLQTAEAVKRYADLAEANEAGLELAQVTAERAEIAAARRDLRELHYLLLKGDLSVDPLVQTFPAVRDSEFDRLLSERGISETDLFAYEARLGAEQTMVADVLSLGTPPSSGDLNDAITDIDTYLTANVPAEQHATHRMYNLREKLLTLRQEIDGGQSATYITNRWSTITTGLGAVNGELTRLIADYDFDGFRTEFNTVRNAVADPMLTDLQAGVTDLRAAIVANAAAIDAASADLQAAQNAYEQARKQNDILRAANSGDLINQAMLNTTDQLAAVLNRMTAIEALPGFDTSQPLDQIGSRRAEYLRMVYERESANADYARSQNLLNAVRGLEDAKVREENLTNLLAGAGDLSLMSAEDLADVFLNNEAQLLARTAATTEQQSYDRGIQHFDELTNVRAALIAARGALATAVADGDPIADLQILRAVVSANETRINELSGLIISNVRGEVGVRTSIVHSLLDPALAPDPDVLAEENAALVVELNQRGLDLAGDAAADLATFLQANREQSYGNLLGAANAAVDANPLTARTDGGPLTLQTEANRAAMRAQLVRQWVLENRAILEAMSAAPVPPPGDERPVSEKWDGLLDGVEQLALGSSFAANFRAGLPTDAGDARIVAIESERATLLGDLDTVLAAADGPALAAAYAGLSAADQSLLARYGAVAAPSLRADLTLIRTAIANDIAALPVNFLSVYLREQSYDAQLLLQQSARAYTTESTRLSGLESEVDALSADILSWQAQIDIESDPQILARLTEQRDAAQLRVDALTPRIAALQTTVDGLAVDLRDSQFRLREISAPGSSAPLLNNALALVSGEAESAQLLGQLQRSTADYAREPAPTETELSDQLKTIIGFYETDITGAIVRDGSDNPIVSAEFQALGISDPAAALEDVLAGSQRGDDLARWSNRLSDWVQDPDNTAGAPRELLAAAELLALSVQDYQNAVAFIENRNSDPLILAGEADQQEAEATAYLEKLRLLQNLEKRLSDSIAQARAAGQDPNAVVESPAIVALRILEEAESQYIFQLFRGYDLNGAPDGLANPELQARADRLRELAGTLREGARDGQLLAIADRYAQGMEIYIATAQAAADPASIAPPGRAGFFSSLPELNADTVRATFNAIPGDEGFRIAATEWLRTTGTLADNVFFREAVLTALADTVGSGTLLKTAVLTNIDSLLVDINAQLNDYLDEMDFIAQREAYIPAGSVDSDVAAAIANLIVATGGMTADEQARLESELYEQELGRAMQIAANVDYYFAGDYPAELREFILVQQYATANERYAKYQAARASSIAVERDLATLDLRGLTGDYGRYILAQDFADYQNAVPAQSVSGAVNAAAADGDTLTLNAYLNQYLQDRNLDPSLLPDGGEQLLLTIEFQEYQRIFNDATAAGGLHLLDESQYAADFAGFVQLAMIEDFVIRNAVTLSGATVADREVEFRAFFEDALDDATYTHGGESLRVRLRGSANMERLFVQAFASMELGGSFPLELNLPPSVAGADPAAALPSPEDYLPLELLAIAGYESVDPAAIIAAVSPEYARAFALLESQRALRPADLAVGLNTSDTELDAILARAGFSGATALAPADRTAVHSALRAAITGSNLAQRGATSSAQALAILRDDRAVAAMAGDAGALADQRILLASGAIAELDNRADALIASSDLPLGPHRSALARALAEALYVDRGAAGAVSAETSALFAAVPGSQDLVEAQIAEGQLSADLAGVLLRDAAIVNQYFTQIQESDADRAYVESLFADQTLATPLARLDLRSDLYTAQAIQARESERAVAGLFASLADGQEFQRTQEREWISEVEQARALREFSGKLNSNPSLISFGNYRTFVGAENSAQQAAYQKYLDGSPDPVKSFEEFHGGRVLSVVSLNEDPTALFALDADQWMDRLRSDNPGLVGAAVDVDGDGDASNDPRSVTVQSVSNEAMRLAAGSTDDQLRYVFQEALANNYLEAVTRMNAAFSTVFRTAALVGARSVEHSAETVAADVLATGYNVVAAAGVNDLSGIEALVQDASDRQAANGNAQLQQMRTIARAMTSELDSAGGEFADAALRKHIADNGALNYIEDTFKPIADNLAAAEAVMNDATAAGDALQNEFAARNSEYVTGLDELSKRFRAFSEASDEFERRQAVKEYAETPYLFASSEVDPESTDGFSADARAEYDLALKALDAAQQRLDEAALDVRAEARLSDLESLVVGLDAGSVYTALTVAERDELVQLRDRDARIDLTLSVAERARFDELRLRETHESYGDVLEARAEHIRHSLRMVRLHKAREVVNAEVERRRSIAEERKRAFDQEMDRTFGTVGTDEETDARNLVYMRLVSKIGDDAAYFNEFRAWYALTTPEDEKLPEGNNGDQPRPQNELAVAEGLASDTSFISELEAAAVQTFFGASGRLAEYAVFASTYLSYLTGLGVQDVAEQELELTKITAGVTIAAGIAAIATGTALVAGLFTAPFGFWYIGFGTAMVTSGSLAIHIMQVTYDGRKKEAEDMRKIAESAANDASVRKVREKQQAYDEALADLNYFLRAPDLTTAKDRIIEWGKQHPDDKSYGTETAGAQLYDLTEDDLKYLFDSDVGPNFYDSDGGVMTLSAEESAEALDVAALREETVFEDSFGRRFNADPAVLLDSAPGTLSNGVYSSGGTDYIEIQITNPNGTTELAYAPIIADPDSVAKDSVYSLGALLDSTVAHGTGLRDQRRNAYYLAGENAISSGDADRSTILKDRDAAFEDLFLTAADRDIGGREFSGYRMVYEEYEQTQREVLERELQQRRDLQTVEWDLREQELEDRHRLWTKRMDTLLAEGTEHWGRVSDKYLQEWDAWKRDHDNSTARGAAEWTEEINKHYEKRQAWEQETSQAAAEKTAEEVLTKAIQELNQQISSTSESFGLDLESINATATVNAAIDEIRRSQPTNAGLLDSITDSVNSFQTRLDISMLTGANTGGSIAGVSGAFREEARQHQRRMRTLANVKAAEEYQRMIRMFADQIEVQNDQIENSTKAAAFGAGFGLDGDLFTKRAGISGARASVNKYNRFETEAAVEAQLNLLGIARITGAELTAFLEEKSDFEVQLYFENQRLATQTVFDRIIGTDPSKRGESRDVAEIGLFGAWVGSAGSSDEENPSEGFGELGASAEEGRPGGSYAGFFPQLNAAAEELAKADADRLSEAGGGPVVQGALGFVNGLNPAMMVMNTATNIQKAVINGKPLGDVIGANMLNLVKQIGMSVGSVLLSMSGVGAGLAAGIMLTMVSSMIQADPNTGEIGFAMTEQAMFSAMLAVGGARLGVGLKFYGDKATKSLSKIASSSPKLGGAMTGFMNVAPSVFTGAVQNFGQAGMQFDSDGNYSGFDYNAAAVGAVVGGLSGGAMTKIGIQPYKSGSRGAHFRAEYAQHAITSSISQTGEVFKALSGVAPASLDMMGGDLTTLVGMATSSVANRAKYTAGLENYEAPLESILWKARQGMGNAIYNRLSTKNQARVNYVGARAMAMKHQAADVFRGAGHYFSRRRREDLPPANTDRDTDTVAQRNTEPNDETTLMDRARQAWENAPSMDQVFQQIRSTVGGMRDGLNRLTGNAAPEPTNRYGDVDGGPNLADRVGAEIDSGGARWGENWDMDFSLRQVATDVLMSPFRAVGGFVARQRTNYWEWNNRLKHAKDQNRHGNVDNDASYEAREGDLLSREQYLEALKASGGLDHQLPAESGLDQTVVNRWNMMVGQRSSTQSGVKAKTSGEIAGLFSGEGQEELADFWEEHRSNFWKNLDGY